MNQDIRRWFSIPFKREGLSELLCDAAIVTYLQTFFVSIPFKREGLSEQKHLSEHV